MNNFIKKYRNLIQVSLFVPLVLISSCDLEEEVFDQVAPENFYKTEGDFDAALSAVHNAYFQPLWGNFEFTAQWLNVGDDELTSNYTEIGEADAHNIVSTNYFSYNSTWKSVWSSVSAANALLANLDNAEITEDKKDEFEGQARFGRALAYFFLVRWWGELPILDETTTLDQILEIEKSSISDVYALIVSDLEKAEILLPVSFPDRGRATQGAAKAILAEVYLHMAGWPLNQTNMYDAARDKAFEIIQSGNEFGYSLEANFGDLWTLDGEASKEYIFQFEAVGLEGFANHVTDKLPGEEGGWENYIAELSYYNSFPEGSRKDATFFTETSDGVPFTDWNIATPTVGKYNDRNEATISASYLGQFNIPVIRLAEVMLIYAEAQNLADGGPNSTSVQVLNDLRQRGNATFTAAVVGDFDQSSFDQAILDEKHWELGFEYSRWFDMTRRELLPASVSKENYLMPIPSDELAIIDIGQNDAYKGE